MASKSGKPIFPMAWAADRAIVFKSWDRTVVPLPFATIALYQGEPYFVPPALSSTQVEDCRLELEQCLNSLYDKAWHEVGQPAHDAQSLGETR